MADDLPGPHDPHLGTAATDAGEDRVAAARVTIADAVATARGWHDPAAALATSGFHRRAAAARARSGMAAAPSPIQPVPPAAIDPAGIHIWLSCRQQHVDEADRDALARTIGASDYSYSFAMRGFIAALARIGMPHTVVERPEFVADIRTRSTAACNIHLGFYPPEHIRLLKGAYNVNCFAWEFDRLRASTEVTAAHAFADQATMLAVADELWLPSAHGAAAVARSVDRPVRVAPSPVLGGGAGGRATALPPAGITQLAAGIADVGWEPLAILPRAQGEMDRIAGANRRSLAGILAAMAGPAGPPAIFLTILNLHDYRKQIRPMLQAFAAFGRAHRNAVLLVKSSTPHRGLHPINSFLTLEQVFDVGERARPMVSDRIWITDAVLTRAELERLYDIAAFYLCTAHAEGQNLPLLEAMARGMVPLSVDHTAMADYIDVTNAIPIRSVRRPFDRRLSRRYGMAGLDAHHVAADDVRAALDAAIALAPADYAALSAAAVERVRRDYGAARLLDPLREAIGIARARNGMAHG